MKVATKPPSRLTRVLVHSHQNAGGSPDRVSLSASRARTTDDMEPPG